MSNIGFRIYTRIDRPNWELVEKFRDIPVANIADNMGRFYCVDTYIKPFSEAKLLGTALTVRVPGGDNLMFHKALDMAQPGDVIVVDGEGNMNRSLCGEIMVRYAMKKGIAGFLIDGCIRDVDSIRKLGFPVYARGVNPMGPYKNGPGEINVPVSCGGQVIFPGDIIVGDADGVVVIRPSDAEDVLIKAQTHHKNEIMTFEQIERGMLDRSWIERSLKEKGCEIIE